MPSPEHREEEPIHYYQAVRFSSEKSAFQAYSQAQEAIFDTPDCDLSVFRIQLSHISHVVLLGDPPAQELEQKLQTILSAGEPVSLPVDILKILIDRRDKAIKEASWVERHYQPGKQL